MQIFGEIPFIKPQNDTQTTDKRLKTMKNERKRPILFWLSFCSLFGAWKIVGILFKCCLSVILWLDKGDFPENLHTVSVLK